jgi:ABC-type branched-subunit amino acid transport system substrate-binding protein
MPFQKNKLQSTSYNFVTGLYEGVLMANEGLIKEGVQISLYAFDTNRDSATTANILANPDMMGMDLILGVMYSNSLPLVQKFSAENGVPFVNPMSENVSGIEANPNAFLLNASTQRQAEACADFAIDSLNNRTAYIITTTKDSALAESYRKSIEKRGGKVANTVVFNFDKMAYYDVVQEIEAAKRQEICHFFIATTDKVAGKTALSAIQNQAVGFPVIAPLSWLEDDQTPIARLASNEIYFYAPFFVNERTKRVKKFTSDFVSRTRVIPSKYAYMGYEAMYQFGMALYLFGSDFPNKIRQFGESTEPQIFNRLDYKDAQVNQHVPILKLENGKLRDIKKYEPEDFED